ncbi:hypothetical protein FLL45_01465 [Aliikangiella marina]|uniref:Uncharacterized protein n=1 Tax=Aliikangiella marina TaxID=1712262 RepID=A0A545THH2_9GAMM|nr:hypothetical protein [Aliikangiella marina]TQV76655.1 hypothetical protein FLL45_01465 [Aliikangiella marina]
MKSFVSAAAPEKAIPLEEIEYQKLYEVIGEGHIVLRVNLKFAIALNSGGAVSALYNFELCSGVFLARPLQSGEHITIVQD